mmetsp:Transcript_23807/g.62307  ORF Transcript_23807/g.62307 Transcript_23807/m.62307 type:complete len:370 (-) Transcript_23807:114-1223(-)|eukprot:CAMPEP_0182923376 /NCGR_PEP_ID=MMETSP0105_2-20130417/5387_1 /TAXON_ID=81532 ORGANISM="Acanthoeca-like sp., Strain 10tr" /NCGR_SAMPLE_ID=MMETSP0105_2 /ASSEMBLY_ACC=CAM_ASM_000205 /LENGTH=369 /DNA_ID=CAMNT_0025061085 /DNA_START=61 /DNA_END=1170 /DNA_ORIENTATION=+
MAAEAPSRSLNFAAGPAKLPVPVLDAAAAAMHDFEGTGCGVMELSHRGPEFKEIITEAEARLRRLMEIPDNYKVLFTQGGGSTQFSAVPLNLFGGAGKASADYIVTGGWSAKAAKEAAKYGEVNEVFPRLDAYQSIPDPATWTLNPDATYVYYCANETVYGVEFPFVPETGKVPLVADFSSNILSRRVDVSKFGVILAGAQKNIGCAGLTIVIVRDDLLDCAMPICPTMLSYATLDKGGSMHNTPPTFPIFVSYLMFGWLEENGGVAAFEALADKKSGMVYDEIASSGGYYAVPVAETARSRMNAPFRIKGGDEGLEKAFVEQAAAKRMLQLKGHRTVGGIRASLYNSVTVDEVAQLVAFMRQFRAANP